MMFVDKEILLIDNQYQPQMVHTLDLNKIILVKQPLHSSIYGCLFDVGTGQMTVNELLLRIKQCGSKPGKAGQILNTFANELKISVDKLPFYVIDNKLDDENVVLRIMDGSDEIGYLVPFAGTVHT